MSIRATGINNDLRPIDRENDGKTVITLPVLEHPEEDPSWREHAACRRAGVTDFFSSHGWRKAKVICATCVVRQQCLDFAMENSIDYGIWGGLSAEDRKVITS